MSKADTRERRVRNRNYEETHQILIKKAVELISELGPDAVSVSQLARATRINRSTVYYHFDSRESLIAAVRRWSSEQMAQGFSPDAVRQVSIEQISKFVLSNPEIIKLWIDDYIAEGDIRERYPQWDAMVARTAHALALASPDEECDAEVYCTLMLTSAFIAPRVFKNSVRPQESAERVIERFTQEQRRMFEREGLATAQTENAKPSWAPEPGGHVFAHLP